MRRLRVGKLFMLQDCSQNAEQRPEPHIHGMHGDRCSSSLGALPSCELAASSMTPRVAPTADSAASLGPVAPDVHSHARCMSSLERAPVTPFYPRQVMPLKWPPVCGPVRCEQPCFGPASSMYKQRAPGFALEGCR